MVLGSLLLFTWQGRNGEERIQEQLWMISGLGLKRSNSNKNRAASLRVALSEWLVSQWPAHPLPQGKAQIPMDLLGLGNHSAADSFLCLLTEAILWIVQQSLCPVICSPQLLPLLFIFQKTAVDILDNPTRTWTSALIFFFFFFLCCAGVREVGQNVTALESVLFFCHCLTAVLVSEQQNQGLAWWGCSFLKPAANRNWSPLSLWMVAEYWPLLSTAEAEQGLGQTTKSEQQKKFLWQQLQGQCPDSSTGHDSRSKPSFGTSSVRHRSSLVSLQQPLRLLSFICCLKAASGSSNCWE